MSPSGPGAVAPDQAESALPQVIRFLAVPALFSLTGQFLEHLEIWLFALWIASHGLVLLLRTPLIGRPVVHFTIAGLMVLMVTTPVVDVLAGWVDANPWRLTLIVPAFFGLLWLVVLLPVTIDQSRQPEASRAVHSAMRRASFVQLLTHSWIPNLRGRSL